MNSLQIDNILRNSLQTNNCYKGIYASNNIKKQTTYPYAIVANTDKYGTKGTHWVGIFVPDSNSIEYFDSFGETPNNDLKIFLSNYKKIKTNKVKIQNSLDISCGPYVIYFLMQRCKGESFENIIKKLIRYIPFSDTFVKMFVYNTAKATV